MHSEGQATEKIALSDREPTYLELNENEDFKLDAHIDVTGQQRIEATGYLIRRRPDGIYRTPLIPQMFFGANGQQLDTWSQYLTAGDHTILRRDSGNPKVPDSDLFWHKISEAQRPLQPQIPVAKAATTELPLTYIVVGLVVVGVLIFLLRKH